MIAAPATANASPLVDRRNYWLQLIPFFAFFTCFSLLTINLPFFWDKDILFSRIAHWLLQNHFSTVLPDTLDPGYPPVLAYLLAAVWKITGITLPAMHLLMLPFTLGVVWQTHILLQQFLSRRAAVPAMILILADPVFLAQTVVCSTDLVMLFFMLLALNAVLHNQRRWLAVAVTGLLFSHVRGITVAMIIGIFDLYRQGPLKNPVSIARRFASYLPGLILFAGWAIYHYHAKGWIGYHASSPWAPCFEIVDGAGFLKNCVIVPWRLADFGHIFVWIALAILLPPVLKIKSVGEPLKSLLVLCLVSLAVSLPTMLIYKILNGHRYLLPVYYFLSLLAAYLLFGLPGRPGLKKWLAVIAVAGLLGGNFWVYPDTIAKGWDASLAHLPYHHLRHKMMQYIERNHIPMDETGSRTPNTSIIDCIELNGDQRSFPVANLNTDKYVFYTNISNLFTDKEIKELKQHWKVEQEYRCLQVRVTLYSRR